MASVFDLLRSSIPVVPTTKALILTGLQNDFCSPDGKLFAGVDQAFFERLEVFVKAFRQHGQIIWVRSEFDAALPAHEQGEDAYNVCLGDSCSDEIDCELFLDEKAQGGPATIKGSHGAQYIDHVTHLFQPGDQHILKHNYSAFEGTDLLVALRCRFASEIYVCGALSNVSAHATALDAASHGMEVILVQDCLAYRHSSRHDAALANLSANYVATHADSQWVIETLTNPKLRSAHDDELASDWGEDLEESFVIEPHMDHSVEHTPPADSDTSSELPVQVTLPLRALSKRARARSVGEVSQRLLRRQRIAASTSSLREHTAIAHSSMTTSTTHAGVAPNKQEDCRRCQEKPSHASCTSHESLGEPQPPRDTPQATEHSYPTPLSSEEHLVKRMDASSDGQAPNEKADVANITATQHKKLPLLGPGLEAESAGSSIVHDLLDESAAATIFEELKAEVRWTRMLHQTGEVPRLVCCQGTTNEDGSTPVYRHPSDRTILITPWSARVDEVRRVAEKVVGHELNHALIQLYRNGHDFISEHSDKTLDIMPDSNIVNVSFGAERTMRLRTKRQAESLDLARTTHRIPMPHNSMLIMSLLTNAEYLHGIKADKRRQAELTQEEAAFSGQRISITFRYIGTFLTAHQDRIWGTGAISKQSELALEVIEPGSREALSMLGSFGLENQLSRIDWDLCYGGGSNVLHLKSTV